MKSLIYWVPAIATAVLIAYLSHRTLRPASLEAPPDWLLHGIEFGFFTLTLAYGLTRGFDPERRERWRLVAAALIASLYGITDEWHQSFVPGRDAAMADWVSDTVGAVVTAIVLVALVSRMAGPRPRV